MSEEINKQSTEGENKEVRRDDHFQEKKDEGTTKTDNGKICAILAYFMLGIVWYFIDDSMKKNEFVKFHVKQALGLVVVDIVLMIVLMFSVIGLIAMPLLNLTALVLAVIGVTNVISGEKKELPIIGAYSSKYLKF